jgi:hypothetical protein
MPLRESPLLAWGCDPRGGGPTGGGPTGTIPRAREYRPGAGSAVLRVAPDGRVRAEGALRVGAEVNGGDLGGGALSTTDASSGDDEGAGLV